MARKPLPIPHWQAAPDNPGLSENQVHVWRSPLDVPPSALESFDRTLASDEKARAMRFRSPLDRNRFVAGRGVLRKLLSVYLHRLPELIEFEYGQRGKPVLHLEIPVPPLHFNLSHSNGLALYVFACDRRLGADVELIRTDYPFMDAAERFFSAHEVQELRAAPPELRVELFFTFWTRKEAYLKGLGEGLEIPLNSLDVSLGTGRPEGLTGPGGAWWNLHTFQPAPDFVACVAGEGRGWEPCFFNYTQWSEDTVSR